MRIWHFAFVALALGTWLVLRPPPGEKIAREMEVSVEAGTITYDDRIFTAAWGHPVTHAGDVRLLQRAYERAVPVVTTHLALTTGEFSDPAIVDARWVSSGNMIWTSRKKPEGSLIVLHLVPQDALVYRALTALDEGDRVELLGREEARGSIEASDGASLRLGHSNHRFFLVSEVR